MNLGYVELTLTAKGIGSCISLIGSTACLLHAVFDNNINKSNNGKRYEKKCDPNGDHDFYHGDNISHASDGSDKIGDSQGLRSLGEDCG